MSEKNYTPTRVTLLAKLKKTENEGAWQEFENTYRGFILSLIVRMGINQQDAEDISQAVLTKVWQKIEDFEYNQNKGKFHNWLAAMTGAYALRASSPNTTKPQRAPIARTALVAPMFPEPTLRRSIPRLRAIRTPTGMAAMK